MEASDLYSEATGAWESYGGVVEKAIANLGAGRTLAGLGRADEAAWHLQAASETFSAIGAAPFLAEANSLLGRGTAVSS